MKIKDNKCKCGHNDFFFADKGSQKGIYCSYCGKWLKWADKDEQNLAMKQRSINDVLNKITDELKSAKKKWWYGVDDDCFMKLLDVLDIIDKYKTESEAAE